MSVQVHARVAELRAGYPDSKVDEDVRAVVGACAEGLCCDKARLEVCVGGGRLRCDKARLEGYVCASWHGWR